MKNSNAKKAVQKLVTGMIKREMLGWPPDCWGAVYQPLRPHTLPPQGAEAADKPQANQE